MEHRYYPRRPVDLMVQLFTTEGRAFQARLLDLSLTGMRVVTREILPERIKRVDVLLSGSAGSQYSTQRLQMYLARKEGLILGLYLVNQMARINM